MQKRKLAVCGLVFCLVLSSLAAACCSVVPASTLTLEAGTDLEGVAEDLNVGNPNVVNCTELVGVPDSLILRVDYSFPEVFFNLSLSSYLWYDGNPAHDIHIQIYNYTLLDWQTIAETFDNTTYSWVNVSYSSPSGLTDFVDSGNFSVRYYHADSGVAGHVLHVDTLLVEVDEGVQVSYVVNSGGALTVNGGSVVNQTVTYPSNSSLVLAAFPDANFTFNGFTVDGVVNSSNPLTYSNPVNGSVVEVGFLTTIDEITAEDALGVAVVFGMVAAAVAVAMFLLSRRRREDEY